MTWHQRLSISVLSALIVGIGSGIFFGDFCQPLAVLGDAFVALLRMTALPYIVVALVANLAKLSRRHSQRLAVVGTVILLSLWTAALATIFVLAHSYPDWQSGSFFSSALTEPPGDVDLVTLFIPANIFAALANNQVPAIVLVSILSGIALAGLPQRALLIEHLDLIAHMLLRVMRFVIRLAPLGVFCITASLTGTMSPSELIRLQAYLFSYGVGAAFLAFVILPCSVATFTPFRYRDVFHVCKDAMIVTFVTGKLIIVLPLLIERTEQLVEPLRSDADDDAIPAIDVLYPVAYPFPHVGKLLAMLFIPFAAWFLGNELSIDEYPQFLSAGVFAYFAGPIVATPFLLDLMHLPHDMFQLFLLSGVIGERIGDALGAVHLTCFSLLTVSAFLKKLTFKLLPIIRFVVVGLMVAVALRGSLQATLQATLSFAEDRELVIAKMQLLEEPVPAQVFRQAAPNPEPRLPGESILDRVRRRGILRVGYNEDKLPFAYFNVNQQLVGFDVNMAHALARDLDVHLEFVRFDRVTLAEQLAQDDFDVVMSGLVGTLERSEAMQHTSPYMDVTLALVVPDFRVRNFRSIQRMQEAGALKIGFVDLSRGFVNRLRALLPDAELIELKTNAEYFESENQRGLDALLISAESGSAFTLMFPEYEVVVPQGQNVSLPLFYAIGPQDDQLRDFLEHWLNLRKQDGTMQEFYDHWILGKTRVAARRRWCVIRDVLEWVD